MLHFLPRLQYWDEQVLACCDLIAWPHRHLDALPTSGIKNQIGSLHLCLHFLLDIFSLHLNWGITLFLKMHSVHASTLLCNIFVSKTSRAFQPYIIQPVWSTGPALFTFFTSARLSLFLTGGLSLTSAEACWDSLWDPDWLPDSEELLDSPEWCDLLLSLPCSLSDWLPDSDPEWFDSSEAELL